MDLKARSKAANIIFSILILLLILLPIIGFIPMSSKDSLSFLTFGESHIDGTLSSKEYLIDEWKQFFDMFKNFKAAYDSAPAAACANVLICGSFGFATFGVGIFYFINLIICLVKTIKGFSGKAETCEVTNPLIAIASSLFVYVGILAGRFTILMTDAKMFSFIGVQPLFLLGCATCMVIICAILHLSKKNEKAVAKVFETIVAVLSLALAVFFLALPVKLDANTYTGAIFTAYYHLLFLDSISDGKSFVVLMVVATLILGVAFSFLCQLVQAAFGDTPTFKRKKDDYPRSLVTKSALYLAFSLLGFITLLICLKMFYETYGAADQVGFGYSAYVALGLTVIFLGLAIANKVIRNKTDDQFVLATNEETPVQEQPVEEAPEVVEEQKEEPQKVEEAPKEEPKQEQSSSPKFC